MRSYAEYDSPVGRLTIVSDKGAVCGLWFENGRHQDASLLESAERNAKDPVLSHLRDWLDAYFEKKRPAVDELPLTPAGSEFQQVVWQLLRDIPYGETVSYGELSEQVAAVRGASSPRCVGQAVGRNPIGIIVPCHRVVGANGSLTGFGGGIGVKVKLLEHEGVDMNRFFIPTNGTAL
ncbi:methylated-DNA--[protein]-cysteine S-methyltransferase [Adlercreutzia sp. ZJ141]|uniref:methylated-DNA--[protein]-cysteine S-methyltransferase n=1 Tax=Adlercreutzia sp. ZJ141 TaxID=2709406 RepID=UPI0013EB5DA6|nr:methylated-DNA--[protein]-cysteine S-methyltransferase [Adlercreutzia sp. ZJ141]